jgi:hypothetical protein
MGALAFTSIKNNTTADKSIPRVAIADESQQFSYLAKSFLEGKLYFLEYFISLSFLRKEVVFRKWILLSFQLLFAYPQFFWEWG